MAIAAHIASGMADTGVGVETAARRFGLDFIPLVRERYFFAIRRSALETPAMRELLAILQSGLPGLPASWPATTPATRAGCKPWTRLFPERARGRRRAMIPP